MKRLVFLLAALAAPTAAAAQNLPTAPYLPLEKARTAAAAAVAACADEGHAVSAAVVERGGATKVLLKAGGPDHVDTVAALVAAGADPTIADRQGITPLAHAERRGYAEVAGIIRAAGAD